MDSNPGREFPGPISDIFPPYFSRKSVTPLFFDLLWWNFLDSHYAGFTTDGLASTDLASRGRRSHILKVYVGASVKWTRFHSPKRRERLGGGWGGLLFLSLGFHLCTLDHVILSKTLTEFPLYVSSSRKTLCEVENRVVK